MLHVEIKKLVKTKWNPIKVEEIIEKTLLDFMEESEERLIAAVYEEESPIMFISNDQKYVDMYKNNPLSFHSRDLKTLFHGESSEQLELVAYCFPNSTIQKIATD